MLTCAVLEVKHAGPQAGRACVASRLDHGLETVGAIREPGQDGGHSYADVDACRHQLLDRSQPLPGMRRAGLGLAPDLVVDGGNAESDVDVGASGELREDVDVAND